MTPDAMPGTRRQPSGAAEIRASKVLDKRDAKGSERAEGRGKKEKHGLLEQSPVKHRPGGLARKRREFCFETQP